MAATSICPTCSHTLEHDSLKEVGEDLTVACANGHRWKVVSFRETLDTATVFELAGPAEE